MKKTAIRKVKMVARVVGLKAVGDEADGIFEAYVSVFGNVDLHGDRIVPGAFGASLERWKASGDPIPVIFSHQWDDLDAHIGEVLAAEEHLPGDERLPEEIKALGGLWTRFQLELDEDFASRVAKKLTKRTLREFSFAYDVLDERRGTDGANELLELDVLEVGPTLKGANPATVLLSDLGFSSDEADAGFAQLGALIRAGAKTVSHAFSPSGDDPTRCILCGLTRNTSGHFTSSEGADGAKARITVNFDGAVEAVLEAVYMAAWTWARDGDMGEGGFYGVGLEATFPAENRAIVRVEGWDDPPGEGVFYEVSFEIDDEGVASISDPHEIVVEVTTSRKARSRKAATGGLMSILARSAFVAKTGATVPANGKGDGNAEDRGTGNAEDQQHGADESEGQDPTLAALDLAEVEFSDS